MKQHLYLKLLLTSPAIVNVCPEIVASIPSPPIAKTPPNELNLQLSSAKSNW